MLTNEHLLLPGAHILMDRRFVRLAAQGLRPSRRLACQEVARDVFAIIGHSGCPRSVALLLQKSE